MPKTATKAQRRFIARNYRKMTESELATRLAIPAEPTFKIDPAATYAARDAAATAVPPETEEYRQDAQRCGAGRFSKGG